MNDNNTVQVGVRIYVMNRDTRTGQATRVGTIRAKCRFVALPRPGGEIATANLTGVSVSTSGIGMPFFLTVEKVQHFTDGPDDPNPEAWAVTSMEAPASSEGCLALVDALGERGWTIEGDSGHPFGAAVETWKATKL
jgi:hypothetical protein